MIHWQCVRSPLQKIITFVWGHRDFSKTCINALYLWLMLTALFSTTPPKSKISLSGFQFYSSLFIMFSRDSTNCTFLCLWVTFWQTKGIIYLFIQNPQNIIDIILFLFGAKTMLYFLMIVIRKEIKYLKEKKVVFVIIFVYTVCLHQTVYFVETTNQEVKPISTKHKGLSYITGYWRLNNLIEHHFLNVILF